MSFGLQGTINKSRIIIKVRKVKTTIKTLVLLLTIFLSTNFAQTVDSMKVLEWYSLFSEYHKNKDCESALPYGWKVIEANPVKFSKWIYFKMEECFWDLHDSETASPELKKSIVDTISYFYDLAIKHREEDKGYFQVRKAYVSEIWLSKGPEVVIPMYEKAFEWNSELSSFYYDRLGQLYKNNDDAENSFKLKALEIYNILSDREPDNEIWNTRKKDLVENIDELLKIVKASWEKDKQNIKKCKELAAIAIQASSFADAIEPIETILAQTPDDTKWLLQLASAYYKTDKLDKSEATYKKLIALEPNNKDHHLNLGIVYKETGKLSQARTEFNKASEVGNNWAYPIYLEGSLYEQSAGSCGDEWQRKLVYLLAQTTYRKALSMDGSLTAAKDRISALSGAIPTKEDYFFRNIKPGTVLQITCVGWIGRSVTAQ